MLTGNATGGMPTAGVINAKGFKRHWIVSYDNADEIRAMYQLVNTKTYGLNYTAQRRYVGNEVMFFSQDLLESDVFFKADRYCRPHS
jgi:DNA adenine methylase